MNVHGGQNVLSKNVWGGYSKWEDYWSDHDKVGEEFYEKIYIALRDFKRCVMFNFPYVDFDLGYWYYLIS